MGVNEESARSFVESCLLPTQDRSTSMKFRDIYKLYIQYVEHFKLFPTSKKTMGAELSRRFQCARRSHDTIYFCEVRSELINNKS